MQRVVAEGRVRTTRTKVRRAAAREAEDAEEEDSTEEGEKDELGDEKEAADRAPVCVRGDDDEDDDAVGWGSVAVFATSDGSSTAVGDSDLATSAGR